MKLRPLLQYTLALGVLSVLLLLLLDRVVMPVYVRQGQVRYLSNVVGLPYQEAVKTLRNDGFRVVKAKVAHTREYPPNQVFEMFPKAYSRVKKGRIIQLTITAEEPMVTVPELVGKTLRAAEIDIARAGLVKDTVHTTYSDDYVSGVVTWQAPKGGNLLRRGDGLALMVSLGQPPPSFYVPGVVGMGFQTGRREILDAGLAVGRVRYLYAPNLLPNTIIDQSVAGGTVLKFKRAVNLTVSTYDREQK